MLTVHHLGVSQSERIVWLCEELGLDYDLIRYDRDPVSRLAPADYKALHPLGTAPVIADGEVVMAESGAIVDYLLAKYAQGRLIVSSDAPNFADYLFWFHFANGSLVASAMLELVAGMLGASGEAKAFVSARADRAFAMSEAHLGAAAYFAGEDFTAADIMMVFSFTTMRAFIPRDLTPYPNIRAYLRRIGERPAYRSAMAKGDPGMAPMLA